jgi:hypothetical protein
MMAIPANSNSQRLGIGAPAIEVVRKIIQIQQTREIQKTAGSTVKSKDSIKSKDRSDELADFLQDVHRAWNT